MPFDPDAMLLRAIELSKRAERHADLSDALAQQAERLIQEAERLMARGKLGRSSSQTIPIPEQHATILIVDDDEAVTETVARTLRLEGFQVRTALSAARGLDEADGIPDAIILDFHLPLIDGLGVLRSLRSGGQHRHTPVAILTGDYFLDDAVSTELSELRAQLWLKPLWGEELIGLTRTLVSDAAH
jgi:CheY-like chemotaxis protein